MKHINPDFSFKGDRFENRYRITGILEAISPIHVGTGESREEKSPLPKDADTQEIHHIDEITRDARGLPYLPGNTIRGVVRNYLWQETALSKGCIRAIKGKLDCQTENPAHHS